MKRMPVVLTPTAAERDAIFQAFARALFKRDMNALYEVVTPDFVWHYHDGIRWTRAEGRDASPRISRNERRCIPPAASMTSSITICPKSPHDLPR